MTDIHQTAAKVTRGKFQMSFSDFRAAMIDQHPTALTDDEIHKSYVALTVGGRPAWIDSELEKATPPWLTRKSDEDATFKALLDKETKDLAISEAVHTGPRMSWGSKIAAIVKILRM